MEKKKQIRKTYYADAIILRGRGYVFVERLLEPKGLALVGGRRKRGESAVECIIREVLGETGAEASVHSVLGIFNDPNRDSRGPSSTTVFVCSAYGILRGEEGKTRIVELTTEDAWARKDEFVSDHYEIFSFFLQSRRIS